MKPKLNNTKLRKNFVGATFASAITVCLSGLAIANDDTWKGTTSTVWTDGTNWSLGHAPDRNEPGGGNTFINVVAPNFPVVTAGFGATTPQDVFVGNAGGASGRLDFTSGTAANAGGNWMFVGVTGGTGEMNISGSGSLNDTGRLYVGGSQNAGGGIGTLTVNTTGTLTTNDFAVGSSGGTGTVTHTAGSIVTNGWNFIGKRDGADGANGTLTINGGTLTNNGPRTFVGLGNSTGKINISSGIYNNNSGGGDTWFAIGVLNNANATVPTVNMTGGTISATSLFTVGGATEHGNADVNFNGAGKGTLNLDSGAGAPPAVNVTGEFWVGQAVGSTGIVNVNAGSISVNNWLAIGRHGNGTVNLSGSGTITKTGGGSVSIANFDAAVGAVNVSGGLFDVQSGNLIVGEGGTGTASLMLTGGTIKAPQVLVATAGTVVSTVSFNGGTLQTGIINGAGGGTSNVAFNGTQIIATAIQPTFITNIDNATVGAGGLMVDSNGFTLTAPQAFQGAGSVVKSGAGSLTLSGASVLSGPLNVNAGKLAFTTSSTNKLTGAVTVLNNATFGVRQAIDTETLTLTSPVTMGSAGPTAIDIDLGNFPGNTSFAPLYVNNNIALGGTVTVNIADALPAVGQIPLIQYDSSSGPGSFVLGTLPQGVAATLDTTSFPGLVFLNVTSVKLPRWTGAVNGAWDKDPGGTLNWFDLVSATATTYSDNTPALLDDNATGTTNVILDITVMPASVTFNNGILTYTLNGIGKIAGPTGLVKSGAAPLTLNTANEYLGVTSLQGGITSVNVLANGGAASSVGSSSAAASNLVLSGGVLNYTGATTTSNRGFSINAPNSGISTTNTLTLSGQVVSPIAGSFIKDGGGNLILSNTGANVIGATGQANRVVLGTLTFEGSGTQTVAMPGTFRVGTAGGVTGLVINNSAVTTGDSEIASSASSTSTMTVSGTGTYNTTSFQSSRGLDSISTITVRDSAVFTKSGGYISVGTDSNGKSTLTVQDSGQVISNGDFNVGDVGTSQGTVFLSGGGIINHNGPFYVGKNPNTSGIVNVSGGTLTMGGNNEVQIGARASGKLNQTAGIVNSSGWTVIGRYNVAGTNGELNVSGGTFNQVQIDRGLIIGEESTGSLTVSGTGVVNSVWNNGILVANGGTGIGTINLNLGGTISAKGVHEGSGGTSAFNFDGGKLIAATGVNAVFMSGLDTVTIKAGGATIDTNGQTVVINQFISDDLTNGSFTKMGTGTLLMNSFNSYAGTTTVAAGTLGGTGSIAGPVSVGATGNINPGVTIGTLTVDSLTFVAGGKITIDMAAAGDTVAVTNALNLTNATLVLNGTPSVPVYILASYGPGLLTGTFSAAPPAGYMFDYNYLGNNQVAITRPPTAYETWIGGYFSGVTDPAIVGPTADPDGDGSANIVEFALGGVPNDGSNNPKVYSIIADSSDAGTLNELLMTVAVRTGTPAFAGSPSPSATFDGITILAQGSIDLGTFNSPTAVVTPVTTGIPASPPAGYEYRTFSLTASDGVPDKGFLRVKVNTTP